MPFVNLPDEHESRWGESLTAGKNESVRMARPEAVAQIEFRNGLKEIGFRIQSFVALRDDKRGARRGEEKRVRPDSKECHLMTKGVSRMAE